MALRWVPTDTATAAWRGGRHGDGAAGADSRGPAASYLIDQPPGWVTPFTVNV